MGRYEYLELSPYQYNGYGLTIVGTDSSALEKMRSMVEGSVRNPSTITETNLAGQPCRYSFRQLDNKDDEIFHSMLAWLCHEGWEPFATRFVASQGARDWSAIHLRKKLLDTRDEA